MLKLANEFEAAVGTIIEAVSSASTELEAAAGTLTKTADTTQQLSGMVAAASEELSSSITEISRHVNGTVIRDVGDDRASRFQESDQQLVGHLDILAQACETARNAPWVSLREII